MALVSTQPLKETNIESGKGGRCLQLTILAPQFAECLQIWEPQTPGTLRACPGLDRDCFTFLFYQKTQKIVSD